MLDLELLASQYLLGEIPGEQLPELAITLLDEGRETPAVRELAGLVRPTLRDGGPLFERMMTELGVAFPARDQAAWFLMRAALKRIVRGAIDPGDGAFDVWSLVDKLPANDQDDTRWLAFVALASEYEDYPEGRSQLGAEIVAAAQARLMEIDPAAA
jgi:hypothetical protein